MKAPNIKEEGVTVDILVSTLWKNLGPSKVKFMVWLALPRRLNIKEMMAGKASTKVRMSYAYFILMYLRA